MFPLKINADYFRATAGQYGVTSLPSTVILTPSRPRSGYSPRLGCRPARRCAIAPGGRRHETSRRSRVRAVARRKPPSGKRTGGQYAGRTRIAGNMPAPGMPAGTGQPGPAQSPATPAAANSMQTSQPPPMSGSPSLPTAGLGDDRYSQYFNQNRSQPGSAAPAQPAGVAPSNGMAMNTSPPPMVASGVGAYPGGLPMGPASARASPAISPASPYASQPPAANDDRLDSRPSTAGDGRTSANHTVPSREAGPGDGRKRPFVPGWLLPGDVV